MSRPEEGEEGEEGGKGRAIFGGARSVQHNAAILIQKISRSYIVRRDFNYVPKSELRRMIKDLDAKEKGFFHCGYYILYLVLYFTIIILQRDMELSHSINMSMRAMTDGYDAVAGAQDIFNYLELLIMNNYNGDEPESPCNVCHMFNDSSFEYFPSGYPELWECIADADANDLCSFYATCLDGTCDNFNTTSSSQVQWSGTYTNIGLIDPTICSDSMPDYLMNAGLTYSTYLTAFNETTTQIGTQGWIGNNNKALSGIAFIFSLREVKSCISATPIDMSDFFPVCFSDSEVKVDDITMPSFFTTLDSITYNSDANGYVVPFDIGSFNYGPYFTLCGIELLKNSNYFLQQIKTMKIVFYSFNGQNSSLYTLTEIQYYIDRGGKVDSDIRVNSFPLRNMYQFGIGTRDELRLFLEILFMLATIKNCIHLFLHVWKDYRTKHWKNISWHLIRFGSCITFVVQMCYWMKLADDMATEEIPNVDDLSDASIAIMIQNIAKMITFSGSDRVYNRLTVINGVLSLFVVFHAFNFHKQLSIVTDTLFQALMNLFHFLIIFMTVLVLFSAICWVLFGPNAAEFKNFTASLDSLILITFGTYDYYSLKAISNPLGPIVFYAYQIIISLLLLNILLSIVLDAYESTKVLRDASQETIAQSMLNFLGRLHGRGRNLFVKMGVVKAIPLDSSVNSISPRVKKAASPKRKPVHMKGPKNPVIPEDDSIEQGLTTLEKTGDGGIDESSNERPRFASLQTLKDISSLRRSVTVDKTENEVSLIPFERAKHLLAASPANDSTCAWYLSQYLERQMRKRCIL